MSPQAAFHDPMFRLSAAAAVVILIVAGAILGVLRWGLRKNVPAIWKTYCSWLIMTPFVMGCIFAGRVTIIVFFCTLAALGFNEFARATGLYRDWWMAGAVYLVIVAVRVCFLVCYQPRTSRHAPS